MFFDTNEIQIQVGVLFNNEKYSFQFLIFVKLFSRHISNKYIQKKYPKYISKKYIKNIYPKYIDPKNKFKNMRV